jgi:alkanesulfonate monooxygenase SsuD/methylene tetrahydromethanopterin reductase-like flavin-dependent oxidoreductase (luciferase family)
MREDYSVLGMSLDPPGIRVGRLREAIHILKGAFAGQQFSFRGNHYTVNDHRGFPKPVQRPHPPLLVGGGGPRVLEGLTELCHGDSSHTSP